MQYKATRQNQLISSECNEILYFKSSTVYCTVRHIMSKTFFQGYSMQQASHSLSLVVSALLFLDGFGNVVHLNFVILLFSIFISFFLLFRQSEMHVGLWSEYAESDWQEDEAVEEADQDHQEEHLELNNFNN